MSYVKEVLGVKFRTVRRWLKVASEKSIEINALLKGDLNVSESEIKALLAVANKNRLKPKRSTKL